MASITRGVPVTFVAEIEECRIRPAQPRWIVEFNGTKKIRPGPSLSSTFDSSRLYYIRDEGLGDPRDSALVRVTLISSGISLGHIGIIGVPV